MKLDRLDEPTAELPVVLDVCADGGFRLYREMVAQLDRDIYLALNIPRAFLNGSPSSEAGARTMQRVHESVYQLDKLGRRRWGKHG